MTTISATQVKELRDKTGAGMMDCKTALIESKGDLEQAVDWLRKKGLSKAANKAGRVAAEGLIGVLAADNVGAMVEVNSETDFVARNERFQDMVRNITTLAPKAGGDLQKLLALTYPGTSATVEAHVKEMVATIGENMSVRRTVAVSAAKGHVAEYVHNKVADGLGKIGVVVALESAGDKAALAAFGRQLAMHIAAAAPVAVTAQDLDPALVERERAVYTEQAKATAKSPEIAAKMVEGRLRKEFYQQVVLMEQVFLGAGGDGKATVAQVLKAAEKTAGAPIKVAKFARYALGEGIDKKDGDFAAEVAAAVGKR
ncbi:MAG TPA: translation elongation factor Ts [Hyphomicrobiaceae bacterium]|nr:translation elongation factor Ts [Hyphomicrobiaceae bacterium]